MKTPEELAKETLQKKLKFSPDLWTDCHTCFVYGYDAAKPEWISVKDRLPEDGARVLIYNSLEYVSIIMANYYDNSKRPFFDHVTLDDIHLTIYPDEEKQLYWMPLPLPPEE